MTERHPPLRAPHHEDVAEWHSIEGSLAKGAGCAVKATAIETYGLTSSGTSEGC